MSWQEWAGGSAGADAPGRRLAITGVGPGMWAIPGADPEPLDDDEAGAPDEPEGDPEDTELDRIESGDELEDPDDDDLEDLDEEELDDLDDDFEDLDEDLDDDFDDDLDDDDDGGGDWRPGSFDDGRGDYDYDEWN